MPLGLVDVPTEALRTLLRAIHRAQIDVPLTPVGLACVGLQDAASDLLHHLRGLEEPAVRAVLVAVLAERGR